MGCIVNSNVLVHPFVALAAQKPKRNKNKASWLCADDDDSLTKHSTRIYNAKAQFNRFVPHYIFLLLSFGKSHTKQPSYYLYMSFRSISMHFIYAMQKTGGTAIQCSCGKNKCV